jgi:hypothetical protein
MRRILLKIDAAASGPYLHFRNDLRRVRRDSWEEETNETIDSCDDIEILSGFINKMSDTRIMETSSKSREEIISKSFQCLRSRSSSFTRHLMLLIDRRRGKAFEVTLREDFSLKTFLKEEKVGEAGGDIVASFLEVFSFTEDDDKVMRAQNLVAELSDEPFSEAPHLLPHRM